MISWIFTQTRMRESKQTLVALAATCYVLTIANIALFTSYSILGLNDGLIANTLLIVNSNTKVLTFSIWGAVYLYQLIWVLYALIQLSNLRPSDPVLISSVTLGTNILSLTLQLIINTVFILELYFPLFVIISLSQLVAMAYSYKSLYVNRAVIAEKNLWTDVSLVRGLVQNGIDIYAPWAGTSAVFTLRVIFLERIEPPILTSYASTFVLVSLLILNFLYVMTDLTICDKFTRYTFSPYILRIWFVSLLFSTSPTFTNLGFLIIKVVILVFTVASIISKVVFIFYTSKYPPTIPSKAYAAMKEASNEEVELNNIMLNIN